MAVVLVFLLLATGILQLLIYQPSVTESYASVKAMYSQVPLGGWVRNIHYWSANILVMVVVLHLLRVFLTGAMGTGRRLNWIVGLVLMFLVLAANFSGYLLPWDQLAYWAVTICTSMLAYFPVVGPRLMELLRGGMEVGSATLTNFYGLHVAVVPFLLVLFSLWHFWLVRKSGGVIRAIRDDGGPVRRVPALPDLVVREAAVGLGLVAVIMLIAVVMEAPLLEQATSGMSPNPVKAPWYFIGFQELLLHLHPVLAICIIPVLASVLLLSIPFWQGAVLPAGNWFGGRRGRLLASLAFVGGILATIIAVGTDEALVRTSEGGMTTADAWSRGGLPAVVVVFALLGGYLLLVRKLKFTRAEAVMAVVVLCIGSLSALTVIGIWFRGPGMRLVWH